MPSPCLPPGQPPNNPPKSRPSHSSNHGEIDCDQHHGRVGRPPRLRPSPPSAGSPPPAATAARRSLQCPADTPTVSSVPPSSQSNTEEPDTVPTIRLTIADESITAQ